MLHDVGERQCDRVNGERKHVRGHAQAFSLTECIEQVETEIRSKNRTMNAVFGETKTLLKKSFNSSASIYIYYVQCRHKVHKRSCLAKQTILFRETERKVKDEKLMFVEKVSWYF